MKKFRSISFTILLVLIIFSSCKKNEETKTPPSFEIIEPSENTEFVKNTLIEFNIELLNGYGSYYLKSVDYYVDNTKIDQENTFGGGCYWQSTRNDIGQHTIRVVATDHDDLQAEDELAFSVTGSYEDYRSMYLGEFNFTAISESIHTIETDSGYYNLSIYDTTYYLGEIREFYQGDVQPNYYYDHSLINNMVAIKFKEDMMLFTQLDNEGVIHWVIDNNWGVQYGGFNNLDSLNFKTSLYGHHGSGFSYYVSGVRN